MKQILLPIFLLFSAFFAQAQLNTVTCSQLKDGDLIFVVNHKGNQITAVTEGIENLPIDHVAIFIHYKGKPSVIQADYRGVEITPIKTFYMESAPDSLTQPLLLVERVNQSFNAKKSIKKALKFLGRPYDYYYDNSDDEIYCSELVQKSFVDKKGRAIFNTIPMQFRDKDGNIPEFWVKLYAKRGKSVPEGAPGTNPGELSRRAILSQIGFLQY